MALIECTECGCEVSDRAVQCQNCGCPMSDILLDMAENKRMGNKENVNNGGVSTTLLSILSFLVPFLGFLFGSAYISADNEEQGIRFIKIATFSIVICAVFIVIKILSTL